MFPYSRHAGEKCGSFSIFLLKIQFESSELPELPQVHRRDRVNTGSGSFMDFVWFEIFERVVIISLLLLWRGIIINWETKFQDHSFVFIPFFTFKMGGHFSAQLFNLSHGTLTYRQSQLHRVRKEKKCYDKRNVLKFVFEVSKLYILHEYYHAPTGWTCNFKSMKFILSVDFMYLPSVWCDVNSHTCS